MNIAGIITKYLAISLAMLKRNVMIYGLGGVLLPFIMIKIIYSAMIATGVVW